MIQEDFPPHVPQPEDESPPVLAPRLRLPCWGAVATLLLSLCTMLMIFAAQAIGLIPVLLYKRNEVDGHRPSDVAAFLEKIVTSGLAISIMTFTGGAVAVFWVVFWSRIRGWSWSDYLAIRGFSRRAGCLGFAGMALILAIIYSAGQPAEDDGTDFMFNAYRTATFLPLVTIALIVITPIWEELFFRGFMHRGLTAAWGSGPAIFFCSACWAMTHVQYEAIGIFLIFLIGIFWGYVRQLSGSTVLVILLHATMNCVAVIATIHYASRVAD